MDVKGGVKVIHTKEVYGLQGMRMRVHLETLG